MADALLVALHRLHHVAGRAHPEGQDSDAELGGQVEAGGLGARHPQRRVGLLDRLRQHHPGRHGEVAALEARVLVLGPHLHDLGQDLVEHGPAVGGVDAEPSQLLLGDRTTDPELEPAPAHDVESGGGLGRADGVVKGRRQQAHAVADADAVGVLGQAGQKDLGGRRERVALQEVVLDLPHVVEAHLLGQDALLEGLPVRLLLAGPVLEGLGPADLVDEAELHGRHPLSWWPAWSGAGRAGASPAPPTGRRRPRWPGR